MSSFSRPAPNPYAAVSPTYSRAPSFAGSYGGSISGPSIGAGASSSSSSSNQGLRLPPIFKRLLKFTQMDFEVAVWEMTHLMIAPKKVFRNVYYRVRCPDGSRLGRKESKRRKARSSNTSQPMNTACASETRSMKRLKNIDQVLMVACPETNQKHLLVDRSCIPVSATLLPLLDVPRLVSSLLGSVFREHRQDSIDVHMYTLLAGLTSSCNNNVLLYPTSFWTWRLAYWKTWNGQAKGAIYRYRRIR